MTSIQMPARITHRPVLHRFIQSVRQLKGLWVHRKIDRARVQILAERSDLVQCLTAVIGVPLTASSLPTRLNGRAVVQFSDVAVTVLTRRPHAYSGNYYFRLPKRAHPDQAAALLVCVDEATGIASVLWVSIQGGFSYASFTPAEVKQQARLHFRFR